jgi:hypothetical protein
MDFAYQGRHPLAKLAAMASTSNGSQGGDTWLTDTRATDHLTANLTNLQTQAPYQGTEQVSVGNGQSIPINHIGNGQLSTKIYNFRLKNLLHSSRISSNLLFVHKLCKDNNCSCYFDSNKFLIQDLPSGKVLYKGLSKNGLYPIHTLPSSPSMSPSATRFLTNADGALTTTVNPEFQLWNTRDQGLLALINSTLSHSVLSMVVGHNSAQEVWKTLEHRFTSTSRANVLNLKIELHNLKKGSESISSYLQKVKNTRDKLVAVGTLIDNEELLHIILKGLPREYGPFCSAIRTRNELVTFEEIMVLLQTEEHSASESSDSGKDSHPMAMFASAPNNRTSNSQSAFYGNNTQFRGRGKNNSQRGRGGRFHNSNQYTQNQFPQSSQGNSQFPQKPEGSRP